MTENKYNKDIHDIDRIIVDEKQIDDITSRIAAEVDDYMSRRGGKLLLVCVLKGSMPFTADLMKKLRTPLEIDFIKASSYGGGTVSSGKLTISLDCTEHDWANTTVLIVEDIIDSGNTLKKLITHFSDKGAVNVLTCTMLDKPERREVELEPDFVGTRIPNEFVVGYGLDADEKYRELPFVGVLKPEIIKKYM